MDPIDRPSAKVGALERRAEWLQQRIKDRPASDKSRTFDQAELAAIEAGILAIKLHGALAEPETSPFLALAELLDALEAESADDDAAPNRTLEAMARARVVLRTFGE